MSEPEKRCDWCGSEGPFDGRKWIAVGEDGKPVSGKEETVCLKHFGKAND